MKTTENMQQKASMEDTTTERGGEINEEMLSAKLEDCRNNMMNEKLMDLWIHLERKLCEVQLVFEQLSLSTATDGYNGSDFVDGDKANSSSSLISRNTALMKEIEFLKKGKEAFDED